MVSEGHGFQRIDVALIVERIQDLDAVEIESSNEPLLKALSL
jgi:hypothetical protein